MGKQNTKVTEARKYKSPFKEITILPRTNTDEEFDAGLDMPTIPFKRTWENEPLNAA